MCEGTIEVPETSRGQTIECPECGSYVEASSGGWSLESSESDTLISSSKDEDQYEENSEEPTKGVGVDRRLIFMILGVAAVVVLGLIILVTVILPSGSHLVEGPESRREREDAVEADLGRQPVISDTHPKEPIVKELQKEERLPAVQYELKFEKGQSYYVRVISDANAVQEVTDQEIINETTSGFSYSFDVSEVDEKGNGWVDCIVDWVMFRQKSPSIEITYDSSEKPSRVPTLGQRHAGFLGESFSVKMTPQGQVKELRGLEKLRKNMEKKIREGRMKQQIMQTLEEQQLADLIKDAMLSPMAVYPDEPVVIGDSWSRTDFLSSRQPFIYEHQWTLKDRKAGTAIIEASAVITSRPDAVQRQGATLKYDMSGKRVGQIEIKESTGEIIHSEMMEDVSGQAQVETMTIRMKTHTVTTLEMTERKD